MDNMRSMLNALSHRGPDGARMLEGNAWALGHNLLATRQAPELSYQPLSDESGSAFAFNGELFDGNGGGDGQRFFDLLQTRGIDALKEIDGFFALAWFNANTNTMLLARDALGVKPLYYAMGKDAFYFASEPQAIIAAGWNKHASSEILEHTLANRWTNGRETPIHGIYRLLPGHALEIDCQNLSTSHRYWGGISHLAPAMPTFARSREDNVTALEKILLSAVESRMDSAVPLGSFCSGGLDSSLITAMASRMGSVKAYVASISRQKEFDEYPWAAEVCSHLGVPLQRVVIDEQEWKKHFVRSACHFSYPLVHESSVALSAIGEAAKEDGIRVILSGEGADELFGGYGSRHLHARSCYEQKNYVQNVNTSTGLAANDSYENAVYKEGLAAYSSQPDFQAQLSASLFADLFCFMSHGLNRLDKNLMQHGVEVREPFLAKELVSFSLSLPLSHKVSPQLKGVLREVAAKYLPRSILDREKLGFSFDPGPLFMSGVNKEFIVSGLLVDTLGRSHKEWKIELEGLSGRSYMRYLSAEIWLRRSVAGQSADEIDREFWGLA